MTGERSQSDPPTAFEMLEGVLLLITGAVVAAPMLPGFLLCVPALVLFGVLVAGPLVAAAALAALAGAILAPPYLLVRSIRGRRRSRLGPNEAPARTIDLPGRGAVSTRRPLDVRP